MSFAPRQRPCVVANVMRISALLLLAALSGPASGAAGQEAEDLAIAILTHIRQCLPASESRSVEYQSGRVRTFANMVTHVSFNLPQLPQLQAAAIAAIDAANNPAATPDTLVRAAIAGVSQSLVGGSKSDCRRCQEAPRGASLPTSTAAGTIRIIALPSLNLPEARDGKSCAAFDHYFDFPAEGIVGVVLDLRGNQGGYLPTVPCVAGQFLQPKTPLLRLADRSRVETLESPAVGRRPLIALPMAVFVDQDTDSGGLALAAALQDAHRASLIGESTAHANAAILDLVTTRTYKDRFLLQVGEMSRINGASLAAGVQVDVAASSEDDEALMNAARALFAGIAVH